MYNRSVIRSMSMAASTYFVIGKKPHHIYIVVGLVKFLRCLCCHCIRRGKLSLNQILWIILKTELSPTYIPLSFYGFGSISWHSVWAFTNLYSHCISCLQMFRPENSPGDIICRMHIWCLKIGIVCILHSNDTWHTDAGSTLRPLYRKFW
jgi:hypothetical protein